MRVDQVAFHLLNADDHDDEVQCLHRIDHRDEHRSDQAAAESTEHGHQRGHADDDPAQKRILDL